MELRDKVIVITGGGKGFGKALAGLFVVEGAHVIISDYDQEILDKTAQNLLVDKFVADVTSVEDIKNLGDYAFKKYGVVDVWVNNAGIQIAPSLVEDADVKKVSNLFNTNVLGYFYGCQIALSYFKKQGYGAIINVNSTAGLEGKPEIAAYSASKFAIKGLTESIRKEMKDLDIKAYLVFPGGMQTELYKEKYPSDFGDYMEVDAVAEKVIKNLKSKNPKIDLIIKRKTK
jgi:NAD(P)-dependent dehydrogenase (short-subunit alcohol dehydrogenase family)